MEQEQITIALELQPRWIILKQGLSVIGSQSLGRMHRARLFFASWVAELMQWKTLKRNFSE